jgi:agmatinase
MSSLDLLVSHTDVFSGFTKPLEKAEYVVFGVPFDITSTCRTGARFGPNAVRQASLNIETYSFRSEMDVEGVPVTDIGDLHVSADAHETVSALASVVRDIITLKKRPVAIGGEHTLTYGVIKGFDAAVRETAILSFDAHLDLRQEFMGVNFSHTTFMRRVAEELKPARIIEVGTRAVCREELEYAEKEGIDFYTALQLRKIGTESLVHKLKKELAPFSRVYLSVDLDVLDPAYAPAVQNPEPDGIDTTTLIDLVTAVADERTTGFDVLECAPNYDQGTTAVTAARVIFEVLCKIEKARKTLGHKQ